MTVVDELIVKLTADSQGFVVGFGQAKGAVKSFKDELKVSMSGISSAFAAVAKNAAIAGTAIAGSIVGALTLLTKQSLESADAMAKLSDKTGVSIETLYGWKAAANNVGTSVEAVAGLAQKLQRNIAQAAQGNEQAAEGFKRLGLNVDQLIKMKPDEAFGKVADAVNAIGSQAERTNAGVEAFGRGFMEASLFVKLGSEGLAESKKRAEELGVTLNRFDAAKVEAVNDSFDELKLALEGIGNTIAVAVSPYLKALVDSFTEGAAATSGYKQKIIDWVDATVKGIGFALDIWKGLRIEIGALKVAFFALAQALQWAGGFLKNLGTALLETAKTGDAGFAVMISAVKYGFAEMVGFVSGKLATMMHMIADSMTAGGVKGADKFREAAFAIGTATGSMAVDAKKNLTDISNAAAEQAEKMRAAWTGMLDINTEHTNNLRQEAIADLRAIANEPLPSSQFDAWAARAKAKIDEVAAAAAASASGNSGQQTKPTMDPVLQEELKKKVESIRESLLSEEQAENESYERKKEALTLYYADKAEKQMEWMLLEEGLTQDHEARIQEIKERAAKQTQETKAWYQSKEYQQFQQYTGLAATLMNSHSRKMFEIGKVAAIGQAIVSTAAGAASALKDVPFPYNLAAMAAVIAAGAVQISTISRTSFGSRSGGAAPSSPAITGGGATDGPVYGQGNQQTAPAKQVMVYLQGDSVYNGRNLVDLINQQLGDGAQLGSLRAT